MEPLTEPDMRAQIERICDSDVFRAAPKLARLLRILAEQTLQGGDRPLGQRLVAQHVLNAPARTETASGVVVRMQVGRLRRHLETYYASAGGGDAIRVEVPKRNYRLRFLPGGPAARAGSPRATERATLAVVEFNDGGGREGHSPLAGTLARELVVALGPFRGVAVRGPVSEAAVGPPGEAGFDFILVGDVRGERETAHLSLRLLHGRTGLQAWAKAVCLPLAADAALTEQGLAAVAAVADELADETGVIACEGMRASATRHPAELSAYGSKLAFWRFLITGSPDDLIRARETTEAVLAAMPDSPVAITAAAMTRLALHLSDPSPRARCPRDPLALMERAVSLAPGDPWMQVHRGFALWIAREPVGLEAICRGLDGRPGSSSFQGMLGSLMVVTAIDPARGEELLDAALARAPEPLYWYCHHAALAAFRRGDLGGMRRALDRIAIRTDPFSLVLRTVAATVGGDHDAALALSQLVLEAFPSFPDAGEVMMRRLLHDDHVDAIAAALTPLDLGWFT